MAERFPLDPELAERILDAIAGGRPPKTVCEEFGIPRERLSRWAVRHPDFGNKLLLARIEMAHVMAEECVIIADTDPDPQKARNRIDARKWYAGTVMPKVYGPRAALDVTIDDRTDLGALRTKALARAARMALDSQNIEDAVVIPPLTIEAPQEPVPATPEEDPFA